MKLHILIGDDGEQVLGASVSPQEGFVEADFPDDFDLDTGDFRMLKWDGRAVVWRSSGEVSSITAEVQAQVRRAEFKEKTGVPPEVFGCFAVLKKLVNGEMITVADRKIVNDFVNKHLNDYEEVVK